MGKGHSELLVRHAEDSRTFTYTPTSNKYFQSIGVRAMSGPPIHIHEHDVTVKVSARTDRRNIIQYYINTPRINLGESDSHPRSVIFLKRADDLA